MSEIRLNTPPQIAEAREIVEKLERLEVGDSVSFDPPIQPLVVHSLYLLLQNVDAGWKITPPKDTRSFWKRLFDNYPVDFSGRAIPQTIAEIQRTR
jgi:hypothetical protein